MSVIFIVLPLALLVVGAGVAAYVWAARKGQFDDLDKASQSILFDDTDTVAPKDVAPPATTPPAADAERP